MATKAEKGLQTSVLCSAVSFQLIFLEIKSHFSADFRFHSTRNLCFITKAEKGLQTSDFRLQTPDSRHQASKSHFCPIPNSHFDFANRLNMDEEVSGCKLYQSI